MEPTSVLLVEDNAKDAYLLNLLLNKTSEMHFDVQRTGCLDGALSTLHSDTPIDVVLLDLNLPDSAGLDTLRAVRQASPDTAIVVQTGIDADELGLEAMTLGAQDYLIKSQIDGTLLARSLRYAIERQQTVTELRESQRRIRTLFNSAQDAILFVDSERHCVDANPAAIELLGYECQELLTLRLDELAYKQQASKLVENWESLLASGTFRGECSVRRKDGAELEVELRAVAGIYPGKQLVIIRDMTQYRQAERELLHTKSRLERTFASLNEAVLVLKPDDRTILTCNPAVETIFGYRPEELVGESVAKLHVNREAFDDFGEAARPHLTAEGMYRDELQMRCKDGRLLTADVTVTAMHEKGNDIDGLVKVIRDVTDRRAAEAAERDQRALAEALRDTAAAINSSLDLDTVLERILSNVVRVLPYDATEVMLLQGRSAYIVRSQGYTHNGYNQNELHHHLFPLDEYDNLDEMALTCKPSVIPNVDDFPGWIGLPFATWAKSFAGAPIYREGELMGFVNVLSKTPDHYSEADGERLQAFADQVAIAIRNARQYEVEQQRRRFAETLRRISFDFNSTLSLDAVFNLILTRLHDVLDFDSASIMRSQDGNCEVVAVDGFQHPEEKIGIRIPIDSRYPNHYVINQQRPLAMPDVSKVYPLFYEYGAANGHGPVKSWLGTPLVVNDETIGMLTLNRQAVQPFTDEEINLVSAFANHAARAIDNARLYEELESHSSHLAEAVDEATRELRHTLERFEAIMHNNPDGVLLLTPQGMIETSNPTAEELFGYTGSTLNTIPIEELVEIESQGNLKHALAAVRERQLTQRLEVTARRQDKMTFQAEVALAPISEGGRLLGIVCSLRDVSAFHAVEQMKDALISTAAHELRTPVTSIQGFSELLLTRQLDEPRQERYLGFIQQQSKQLARIIDDLLDIAKLESGHGLELNPTPIDLEPIIDEAVRPFIDVHPDHTFRVMHLNRLPPVFGDPFRLNQVINNLVSNAVKYSPDGGPIYIKTRVAPNYLMVSVEDKGVGIKPEQMGQLFERFYRADTSNTAAGGTGLGLTICKLIIEGHGGEIWVDSTYGEGSTFTFTLPLSGSEAPAE